MGIEKTSVYKTDAPNAVDTVIIFNAALAAYNAKKYDKAIEYYKEAAKYKYNGAKTYSLISNSYVQKQDTASALDILHKGLSEFKDNSAILVEMINIYLVLNKVDDAISNYKKAAAKDDNIYTSPRFLFKAAQLALLNNKKEEANKLFLEIKEKYETSREAANIDAYILMTE